jgi:collagenase-like PrtC family protease
MLRFTVGTNWQDDLIPKIKRDSVKELYGKLASDFVGGGRPSYISANPSEEEVRSHIKQAHQNGMEFNYLLSAACLGNKEFTATGQKKIRQLLDWIVSMEVDSVTVAIPYLLQLIKKQYSQLKVCVSSFANVNTIERAKYWEDLGADRITLDEFTLNRDFRLLRQIRNNLSCELQLIANNGCLYNCPFVPYHGITISHSSQSEDNSGGFLLDYCVLSCKYIRIANPVNFIRADWIRPEDIHFYEDIGIDSLKLVDRTRPTAAIALAVEAYDKREYNGNLMDLLPALSRDSFFSGSRKIWRGLKYFLHSLSLSPFLLCSLAKLDSKLNVYIDNPA